MEGYITVETQEMILTIMWFEFVVFSQSKCPAGKPWACTCGVAQTGPIIDGSNKLSSKVRQ